MALIVEDGTGKSDAESYLSVATADTISAERNDPSAWTALGTAPKESALRYATEYLDGKYKWSGGVSVLDQALGWPRAVAYDWEDRMQDSDIVPVRVEIATWETAPVHVQNALNLYLDRGGEIQSEQVDVIVVSYFEGAPPEVQLPHVTRILLGLGKLRGVGMVEMARA